MTRATPDAVIDGLRRERDRLREIIERLPSWDVSRAIYERVMDRLATDILDLEDATREDAMERDYQAFTCPMLPFEVRT
jgi:hypothetical protein